MKVAQAKIVSKDEECKIGSTVAIELCDYAASQDQLPKGDKCYLDSSFHLKYPGSSMLRDGQDTETLKFGPKSFTK